MQMKKSIAITVGLIVVAVLAIFSTTFSVAYNEIAIRSRFGKVDESSIVREPGLHFRLPFFADAIHPIDTRMQVVESPLVSVHTKDGQQVVVRGFLLWKVNTQGTAPLDYFETYADVGEATGDLRIKFRDALHEIDGFSLGELLNEDSRLPDAEAAVLARMNTLVGEGIEPMAAGISRLVFKESTTGEVTRRMQARRDTLAENEKSQGAAEAQRIRSESQTTAEKILAFASQRAQEIRTEGEERAATYLSDMNQDEELALFLIWLDTLEKALSDNTTIMLDMDQAPFHLLDPSADPARTSEAGQ